MSNTRHTPGEWLLETCPENANAYTVRVEGREGRIADVYEWAEHDEAEANARLIASSPDMEESLIWCLEYLCGDVRTAKIEAKIIEHVRKSLVKAGTIQLAPTTEAA